LVGGLATMPVRTYLISYDSNSIVLRQPVQAALGGKKSDKKRCVEKEFGGTKAFCRRL
jgi:hypothetical protein